MILRSTPLLFVALWLASATSASANPTVYPVRPLTLSAVDAACFYAPTAIPHRWPFARTLTAHPIRGGFNDPRTMAASHWGADVAASVDSERVYAMASGTIGGVQRLGLFEDHFWIGGSLGYYHVTLAPSLHSGSYVTAGQYVGRVRPSVNHVHVAEYRAGCGYLDLRRPTGPLRDPANTEAPVVGGLSAFVANEAAYRPFRMATPPSQMSDASTPLQLDALRGVVDFRASVTDTPRHATSRWPQQPEMPAAVQSYIAPAWDSTKRYGAPVVFDGARLLKGPAIYRVMAPGTVRYIRCFGGGGTCTTRLILHVAGGGFDTRRLHNGNYQLCVRAITIRGRTTKRCTAITIANP